MGKQLGSIFCVGSWFRDIFIFPPNNRSNGKGKLVSVAEGS